MGVIECTELTARINSWEGKYSCRFHEGDWHVISGSSGSGKSTLLQMMLGLIQAQAGDITIDGKSIISLPPHRRSMSFMAQNNLLLPHLSIFENLNLALHDSLLSQSEKSLKIDSMISLLKLEGSHLRRMPYELSGGQLSRCNLARALLRPSRWLLLDEPFAAVDRPTRLSILEWLKHWQQQTGACVLLVSHDLDDIFNVASHVTVLSNGRVIESQSLAQAIKAPQSKTTASILRAGVITIKNGSLRFIGSDHLCLHPSNVNCDPNFLDVIELKNARTVPIGKLLRIIELSSGVDVNIPAETDFSGSLWFDRRNAITLADS